jgi:MFS family permease
MRILTQRSVALSFFFTFFSQAAMLVVTYYIPLFFQVIESFSPLESGLATLPLLLSLVIGSIFAGGLVQRIGYPKPFMLASAVLASIGAGLISTWQLNVSKSIWIGFQVLFGIGIGMGMQQPSIMAQIVLPKEDQPTGVALVFFGQNLGGAIFVSVAQNVFTDELASKLSNIPGLQLDKKAIVQLGATTIKKLVSQAYLRVVLEGYRDALRSTFLVGASLVTFSIVGAALVEWRSTKDSKRNQPEQSAKDKKEDV